jgi:hypothetical protein
MDVPALKEISGMRSLAPHDAGESHGRGSRHDAVHFCTHCGAVSDDAPQRVCQRCEMGVVLTCAREALGEAFLVVTHDQRVSAASASVEPLLGDPDLLVGESLHSLLCGGADLARSVARAAMGSHRISVAATRTPDGRRLAVRIAACGPPAGALVVIR